MNRGINQQQNTANQNHHIPHIYNLAESHSAVKKYQLAM